MSRKKLELKLNLGCGANKIPGFVNIDIEPSVKPDLVCNFITNRLPYKDSTADEVVLFHTIEHITKPNHPRILNEVWRVLKPTGTFYISYPEFERCVKNWRTNYRGRRDFWEKTIYGRQAYPSDFHVALMHTPDFKLLLTDLGFIDIVSSPELTERFNTILSCKKGQRPLKYEGLLKEYMERFKLVKVK